MQKVLLGLSALILVSGCSAFPRAGRSLQGAQINLDAGGNGVFDGDYDNSELKSVDLPSALDPNNYSGWAGTENAPAGEPSRYIVHTICSGKSIDNIFSFEQLNCAFEGFASPGYFPEVAKSEQVQMSRRNAIQDRIILASNVACDEYKRHLLDTQSDSNFLYGNAVTLTAALGTLLSPESTARALSGTSAFLSGSRAEYNSWYFRQQLVEVITQGIAESRDTAFRTIMTEREGKTLDEYSIQQAISHAIQYHSKCSLIAGLESAKHAQSFYSDPGLQRLSFLLTGSEDTADVAKLFSSLQSPPEPEDKDQLEGWTEENIAEFLAALEAQGLDEDLIAQLSEQENQAARNLLQALKGVLNPADDEVAKTDDDPEAGSARTEMEPVSGLNN